MRVTTTATPKSEPLSVLDLVRRRLSEHSLPQARRRGDNAHLALAIEGGGMRGVVSAGMLTALEQLGALPAFDSVWGASAGALNGAYFLSGQAAQTGRVYPDHLTGSDFINPRRFLRGGDFISLDYLFALLEERFSLDVERLLKSPISFHPTSFSLSERRVHDLGHPCSREDLFLRLRASAQVPLFAGEPIEVDGQPYLDAACGEFIPVQTALAGGATHVLALHTRAKGELPPPLTQIERRLYQRRLQADPRLLERLERRIEHYRFEMNQVAGLAGQVQSIHPGPGALSSTERRREPVLNGYLAGIEALLESWPETRPQRAFGRQWLPSGQLEPKLQDASAQLRRAGTGAQRRLRDLQLGSGLLYRRLIQGVRPSPGRS